MNLLLRNLPAVAAVLLFPLPALLPAEENKLFDILPQTLEDAAGKKMAATELDGKFVGLYFSAGWCPPCRAFTPHLVEFRNANTAQFEVVFVSFDKSNMEKQKYIRKSEMPWPSLPGAARKDSKTLSQMFQVQGLPTLVIFSPEGKVVSLTGRGDVMSSPREAIETWKKASQS